MSRLLFFLLLIISCKIQAQRLDTLLKQLDSLSKSSDTATPYNLDLATYNETTKINVPTYFILLGSDLKQAFTKPFHMKRRDWKFVGIGVGGIALLTLADPPVQQFGLRLRNSNKDLQKISLAVTNFGGPYEFYTLGALGAYGFIFKKQKMKTTTLLASQAYITGTTIERVMKYLSGRIRPIFYDSNTKARPTFKGPFSKIVDFQGNKVNTSFPSGHTTVAFAAATVYAMQYRNKPLIPIICYSAASLIGLSRITENKHWLSDVVAGAAIGYLTGRQVVNNYHRYASIKTSKKKGNFSFNLQYNQGVIVPGLVYSFK